MLHRGHDVRCAAADTRRQGDLQVAVLLDDEFEHFSENQLLRHRLRRDADDSSLRTLEERISAACCDESERNRRKTPPRTSPPPPRIASAEKDTLFEASENGIGQERQTGDEERAVEGERCIIRRDAAVDGDAEAARTDEGRDARERDRHRRHVADACENDGHGERQGDAPEHLEARRPHADRRLDEERIDILQARMRILHHRQERVERQGDDRRRIADARKRQKKAEHRDRRDRVEKIDDEKRRLRHAVNLGNQNAHRAANHDSKDDRHQRYGDMLQRKLQEKIAALLEKSYHL